MSNWYVYIVRCSDQSFYTGITNDVERRIDEHNNSDLLGARYTRTRCPVNLVYQESLGSRSEATRREYKIKGLSRTEKEALVKKMQIKGTKSVVENC
jgi:putative endonuclease